MRTSHKPETAARLLSTGQMVFGVVLLVLAIAVAVAFGPVLLLKVAVAVAIAFYIVFVGFKFMVWHAAAKAPEPALAPPKTIRISPGTRSCCRFAAKPTFSASW